MNRYRITALEEVDVAVSDEHPVTIRVRGVPRQVMTRGVPRWKHLHRGEACEVTAIHRIRGDLFEENPPMLPVEMGTPVVIHAALKVEGLPRKASDRATQNILPNSAPHP